MNRSEVRACHGVEVGKQNKLERLYYFDLDFGMFHKTPKLKVFYVKCLDRVYPVRL